MIFFMATHVFHCYCIRSLVPSGENPVIDGNVSPSPPPGGGISLFIVLVSGGAPLWHWRAM